MDAQILFELRDVGRAPFALCNDLILGLEAVRCFVERMGTNPG